MDKSHDIGNISKTNIAIQTESTPVKKPIETYAADKDVNLFLQKPADEIHDTHRNETTEILNKNLPSTQTEESSQPNEVDSSISINKSVQTIVDIIFFPFYPIRVKVISLELTIKYSTFIVNTLKIVTISLSASIIAIAAILSVPELFAGAPLVLILAYIFWPTRPMNSNDNITIQDENSNLVMNENNSNIVNNEPTSTANNEEDLQEDIITPQKHKKQLFEREVEKNTPKETELQKIVEVTVKKADVMEAIVEKKIEKTIADQKEALEIRKKNRKNPTKKEVATNTENDAPVTEKDIEDVAKFLIKEEDTQEKLNKKHKESLEIQEKKLKERIKNRKEKNTDKEATEETEHIPNNINPEVVTEIENPPTYY
jgi:hypothetical protein